MEYAGAAESQIGLSTCIRSNLISGLIPAVIFNTSFWFAFPPEYTNLIIWILGVSAFNCVRYWSWECLQHSVTVELAEFSSFRFPSIQDLMGWSQSDRFFFNRQDVMTRGGKGGAEWNTHKKRKISESVTRRRIWEEKKSIWAVPHVLRISSLHGSHWDSDGWLGGSWGGKRRKSWSAKELLASVRALRICFVLCPVS